MKPNKLPVDGYIIDHAINDPEEVYHCCYCGKETSNYTLDYFTRKMDTEHCCDVCMDDRYQDIRW